ncbi:MAG: MlaA family lipoprotein [Candidatus Loosdrechtia sp.]|uniref:MlaA family lipoprotein n=1 Tax=Candidatus Loosdrechtia sp. TaxID=3101272 RepID=UPI003A6DE165|nr:MAG: VacJ family lipoprotein [Candidatus Jettenia sp. AMX2]
MKIVTTVIFLYLLTICFHGTTTGNTDYVPGSEVESENNKDDASNLAEEKPVDINKEIKPVEVELEATINKEILLLETSLDETIHDEYDYEDDYEDDEYLDTDAEIFLVKDPLQPYNRAIFTFNDKVYYHVIKPVTTGYKKVLPEPARLSFRRFFINVKMPVRFVNCLLQGKFKGAGTEGLRFLINSTIGVGGFFDPATTKFQLERQDVDFGQTLAKYNIGDGFYIKWPFIGPSTARDTVGYAGDVALNPIGLLSFFIAPWVSIATNSYDTINETSLDKGTTYETITKTAIDPYIALQDAYMQNRLKKIRGESLYPGFREESKTVKIKNNTQ